ncbi:MAG: hypothetical protein AVDCRST_MAG35-300, partial [uncultured Quadrisphaera sp.]
PAADGARCGSATSPTSSSSPTRPRRCWPGAGRRRCGPPRCSAPSSPERGRTGPPRWA